MELPRQDPDQLLRAICSDTYTRKSGKLKIFFGYAAGVERPMPCFRRLIGLGVASRVVAGYIEPCARPQTMAFWTAGSFWPKKLLYEERPFEFDIDAALKRKSPAHTGG